MNRDPKLSPQRATSPGILRLYNDIKNDFAPITSKANTIRSDKYGLNPQQQIKKTGEQLRSVRRPIYSSNRGLVDAEPNNHVIAEEEKYQVSAGTQQSPLRGLNGQHVNDLGMARTGQNNLGAQQINQEPRRHDDSWDTRQAQKSTLFADDEDLQNIASLCVAIGGGRREEGEGGRLSEERAMIATKIEEAKRRLAEFDTSKLIRRIDGGLDQRYKINKEYQQLQSMCQESYYNK